jgi:energy-coupling factor transporter ATP-binding protein EcfA2
MPLAPQGTSAVTESLTPVPSQPSGAVLRLAGIRRVNRGFQTRARIAGEIADKESSQDLAKPEGGSIAINCLDITRCSRSELGAVRRRIGVAFQGGALFNTSSVADNAALPLRELTRLAESTIKLTVWMKLMPVGLSDAGSLYPAELSWGMRKQDIDPRVAPRA